MNEITITVLTPTYNRGRLLKKLYKSLYKQTYYKFQWLIIDDGSNDNTDEIISSFNNSNFKIDYYKKKNGGKHTALNYAHPYIYGSKVIIVDSDDILLETALEQIEIDWAKYCVSEEICGISYEKRKFSELYTMKSDNKVVISNHFKYRVNGEIKGDRAEVLKTHIFKKYDFPIFLNEKFILESWLWNNIALDKYKTVYINKVIYGYDYLDDGLTKKARKLRMENPYGSLEDCKTYFNSNVCIKQQIRTMILFWVYGFSAKLNIKKILEMSGRPKRMMLLHPIGLRVYKIWERKYLNN